MGFVDFSKLSFALSSLAQPFDQMRSIQEYVFVILSQRKVYTGRLQKETAGKRTDNKMAAPEASVHPVRIRLCYHFYLYQTNERCSQSVSRRRMLLIRFNKSCLRVTAPNATKAERRHSNDSARNTKITASAVRFSATSHMRFQILDSSYQFNLCRWYY